MNIFKRTFALYLLFVLALQALAQGANGTGTYYKNADGKKGRELKTAMWGIIKSLHTVGYDGLWEAYYKTDLRPDGKIWDMYSSTTNFEFGEEQCGNYSDEGSCYNREHSMPKSWFKKASPMYSDLVHVVPTDGYVNNRRGNYPFGETNGEQYMSEGGFSKLGPSSISGYSGTVFEPNDEYKGDFARIYFYMATCYEDKIASWDSPMLAHNKYPAYTDWAINMLLRWAAEDPVSQKEIDRNNAVEKWQGNRNPFVDYPGLEQYVWGEYTDQAFSYSNYTKPDFPDYPDNPGGGTDPDDPDEPVDPTDPPVSGEFTFTKVTSESQLSPDYTYLIVYEDEEKAMGEQNGKYRNPVGVTLSGNQITTNVNGNGQPRALNLGGTKGAYTLYDGVEKVYLALKTSDNELNGSTTATTNEAKWTITFGSGCSIRNNAHTDKYINYNSDKPRFACYKTSSNQQPVALYRCTTTTGIAESTADDGAKVDVYTVTGMKVRSQVTRADALDGLEKGVYIIGNKKYLVK